MKKTTGKIAPHTPPEEGPESGPENIKKSRAHERGQASGYLARQPGGLCAGRVSVMKMSRLKSTRTLMTIKR